MKVSHSRGLIAALLACVTTLAGCRNAPGRPTPQSGVVRPDQVLDFATLYGQNCSACHGASGKNGAAISLANPVYLAFAGVQNIQRVTANGVPGTAMPPFSKSAGGLLTDQQIAILAAGMESTWANAAALAGQTFPPYASSGPGNPAEGEKAFAISCARCHGTDGTGASAANGVITGSLIDPAYLSLISDQGLRSIILAGQTEQGSHDWRSYGIDPTHPIGNEMIANIVAWLASHRIATPGQPYQQHP